MPAATAPRTVSYTSPTRFREAWGELTPLAAQRYQARLGQPATTCYVHPAMLPDGAQPVDGIQVKASPRILKGHLWVGTEE